MTRFIMPVLLVQDVAASAQFYQGLFDLEVAFSVPGRYLVFENAFALWLRESAGEAMQHEPPHAADPAAKAVALYFESEDVEAFASKLELRSDMHLLHGLKTEPWGQRSLRFLDLDGFVVEVAESMADVAIRLLAQGLGADEVQARTMLPRDYIQSLAEDI